VISVSHRFLEPLPETAGVERLVKLFTFLFTGFFIMAFSLTAFAWEPKIPDGVQGPSSWYLNGQGGRYFVPIVQGRISGRTTGIVRTDSNCVPDSQGLSHCYNKISLMSGGTITIQNTHKMSSFRCLHPGQRVKIMPNGLSSWAVIETHSFASNQKQKSNLGGCR